MQQTRIQFYKLACVCVYLSIYTVRWVVSLLEFSSMMYRLTYRWTHHEWVSRMVCSLKGLRCKIVADSASRSQNIQSHSTVVHIFFLHHYEYIFFFLRLTISSRKWLFRSLSQLSALNHLSIVNFVYLFFIFFVYLKNISLYIYIYRP
jgi:hypothetical protein